MLLNCRYLELVEVLRFTLLQHLPDEMFGTIFADGRRECCVRALTRCALVGTFPQPKRLLSLSNVCL